MRRVGTKLTLRLTKSEPPGVCLEDSVFETAPPVVPGRPPESTPVVKEPGRPPEPTPVVREPGRPPESPPTPLFPPRSTWAHGDGNEKSGMLVTMANNEIKIVYWEPRLGMVEEGVRRGTLLFKGEAFGDSLSGTAFIFDRHCKSGIPYQVTGDVLQGRRKIIMTGQRPSQLDSACQPVRYRPDTLVFDRKMDQ
jgi:hypothetical protein